MRTGPVVQGDLRRRHARRWLVVAVATALSGCGLVFPVERVEQARVSSPDGRVQAVVVRTNAGATTGYAYHVYIVPAGRQPEKKTKLLTADGVSPGELRVAWAKPRLLHVSLDEARIFHYTNFWMSRDVDDYEYEVRVRLDEASASVQDDTSPPAAPRTARDTTGADR